MSNIIDETTSIAGIIASRAFQYGVFDYLQGEQRFDEARGDLAYEYGRLYAAAGGPVPICHKWADGTVTALPEAYVFCIQHRADIAPDHEEAAELRDQPMPPAFIIERWFLDKHPEMRAYIEWRDAPTIVARDRAAHKMDVESRARLINGLHSGELQRMSDMELREAIQQLQNGRLGGERIIERPPAQIKLSI